MYCPVDNETLVMTERNGVEIDYCPKCRGVWLDRGELDKIVDRAAAAPMRAAPVVQAEPPRAEASRETRRDEGRRDSGHRRSDDDDDDDDRYGRSRRKRRESFLGDLFDF